MSRINDPEQNPQPGPAVVDDQSRGFDDFDDDANRLWYLYKEKARSHDEVKLACLLPPWPLYRRSLSGHTSNPAQQMVFYEQQSVDLLKQISAQISTLSPQALVISLSAALLATLIQRWVRDHMHIFYRDQHPLKVSRIRQYLHEGVEGWHMAAIAEVVPTLIHVSLFLFLVALAVFLSNANWTVAKPTIFFITVSFAWYLIATILPVAKPQFPLRSPVSSLLWFGVQSVSPRLHKDRIDGKLKPVNKNMGDGLMELALEGKPVRMDRDRRAIAWLAGDLTDDSETESFASSIPGSFNPEWGLRVWGRRENESDGNSNESSSGLASDNYDTLYPLCTRIGHLFQKSSNHYLFENEYESSRRSHISIQAIALLVFRVNADLNWFGDIETIGKLLKAQDYRVHPQQPLAPRPFAANWTGLSIVVIRNILSTERLKMAAKTVLLSFERISPNEAISCARRIDNTLNVVWDHVEARGTDPRRHGDRPETDGDTRHREWIEHEIEQIARTSSPLYNLRTEVDQASCQLTKHLRWESLRNLTQSINACDFLLNPLEAQLKYLHGRIVSSSSLSSGWGVEQVAEQGTRHAVEQTHAVSRLFRPTERQIWRLRDLCEGGAVGFTLELYLLSLRELLPTSVSSNDSRDNFFSAIEAITSNRALS
ncbi:hypothetical protein BGW80DRAFT_1466959 [Lactifluus volemus]|nr:hypothetical protein BGW80DRAFT_1466959 [Lactifluus volemus]